MLRQRQQAGQAPAMRIDTGTDLLLAEVDGPIGRLTFNDPARHNVLSLAMQEAIPAVVGAWQEDPAVRVIVTTGAGGRAFVAGADISEFGQRRTAVEDRADYDKRSGAAWRVWRHVTKPVIAAIDGYCIGGGLLMALQADIRICSEPSTFAIPAARLGLGYGFGGVRTLMQHVNPAIAAELLYSARRFSSEEARVAGLVNRVVAVADLHAEVTALAEQIARNAPLTITACKAAIRLAAEGGPDPDTTDVDALAEACFRSEDYKEGQAAFLAKRDPAFKGS
jgi:enoyl-CoA hydratase/carnithine racemase